jgi:anti-sigma regulatory factor (Ser/Thr protein kinase)
MDRAHRWTAPARIDSVPTLRDEVAGWLREQGTQGPRLDDWRLIVSELVANACQNAPEHTAVTIEACKRGDRVELVVANSIGPEVAAITPANPGSLAHRGRGLHIVDELASGLDIRVSPDSVQITCWLPTDPPDER